MRRMPVLFGAAMLISAPGFAEDTIATKDYAADADVAIETIVDEVRNIPTDAVNMKDGMVEFAKDEVQGSAKEFKAALDDSVSVHAKVRENGLSVVDAEWGAADALVFRSYKVSEEIGKMLMAGADASATTVDVSTFFSGVDFEGKASAYYNPGVKRLLVRQTMGNVIAMEGVLADYRSAERELFGHQVEIETKFVEVNQTTLNELGFAWNFVGKGSDGDLRLIGGFKLPAGSDLLTDGLRSGADAFNNGVTAGSAVLSKASGSLQWDMAITAMEQATDTDVLSAPRVVARDGSTATIRVGEEQMLPRSFEADNQETSPYLAYTDWELELMGVSMEVTPEIRDGGLIDLSLHPIIKDLVDYDEYTITPSHSYTAESDNANGSLVYNLASVEGALPVYRVRELETVVTVADGSTVGMGGLIYDKTLTFNDEVPVLGSIPFIGRLFRSEGESSEKRNLMIFVTATQMGVNGQTAAEIALDK